MKNLQKFCSAIRLLSFSQTKPLCKPPITPSCTQTWDKQRPPPRPSQSLEWKVTCQLLSSPSVSSATSKMGPRAPFWKCFWTTLQAIYFWRILTWCILRTRLGKWCCRIWRTEGVSCLGSRIARTRWRRRSEWRIVGLRPLMLSRCWTYITTDLTRKRNFESKNLKYSTNLKNGTCSNPTTSFASDPDPPKA